MPYFSIIIPCLNEEKSLPHLLKDLRNQSYQDFDIWVVDGSSDDNTQALVKKAMLKNTQLHLITSDMRNVGHQRNLGAKKGKSEYLLFFDADNRLPDYYLAGLHYFCAKDHPDAFTTFMKADTQNPKDVLFAKLSNIIFDGAAKMGDPFAYGACIGCKRDVFKKVGGFDETIKFGEDTEFVRRVVRHAYNFSVFHEPVYVYSLRRFRKEGTLSLTRRIAPLGIKLMLNKKLTEDIDVYPMLGGTYFDEQNKEKAATQTFQHLKGIIKMLKEIVNN